MNELELRKYCLDHSVEILGWYKNYFPQKGLNPIELADILYRYLTTEEKAEFILPGTRGQLHSSVAQLTKDTTQPVNKELEISHSV